MHFLAYSLFILTFLIQNAGTLCGNGKLQTAVFTPIRRSVQQILPAARWNRQLCFIIRIRYIACDIQAILLIASTEYKLFIPKQHLFIAAMTTGFQLVHARKLCNVSAKLL